jgi:hypothetical protein
MIWPFKKKQTCWECKHLMEQCKERPAVGFLSKSFAKACKRFDLNKKGTVNIDIQRGEK